MNYTISGESVSTLNKDIEEAKKCFRNAAYKATMVLCGSVLELALLDRLSIDPSVAKQAYHGVMNKRARSLERWSLDEMLRVSRHLYLLRRETFELCNLLCNYRNLIHPSVSRRASVSPNKTRAQRSLEAIKQALEDLDSEFATVWQNVYVINIRNVGSSFVHSKGNLQKAVNSIARQKGLASNRISSYAQMRAILRNPPKNAIVVNSHGQIMPVPRGRKWRNFYNDLGKAVQNYGWIFVNIGGYPFWYSRQGHPIGPDGLNAFLSPVHISADCMNPAQVDFTTDGIKVIRLANMAGLPHRLFSQRCAIWQGVSQKTVFLTNGLVCGASAVRIGRGWFVHIGSDSSLGNPNPTPAQLTLGDTILGNLGTAAALYVAGKL